MNKIEFTDCCNSSYEEICTNKFGRYLRNIRQSKNMSIRTLAKAVGKTPTYLSDIEKGNNRPPDKILLEAIIKALDIDMNINVKENLYNLAAEERNEIPADIRDYICTNKSVLVLIRQMQNLSINEEIIEKLENVLINKGE